METYFKSHMAIQGDPYFFDHIYMDLDARKLVFGVLA